MAKKKISRAAEVANPGDTIFQAISDCFSLLGIFGIVEKLPAEPMPSGELVQAWQWEQYNPQWNKYVPDMPPSAYIVPTLRSAQDDVAKAFEAAKLIVDPRGLPGWSIRCAATLGLIGSYIKHPFSVKQADDEKSRIVMLKIELSHVCHLARDRLVLDGFASLVRTLADLHAQFTVASGGRVFAQISAGGHTTVHKAFLFIRDHPRCLAKHVVSHLNKNDSPCSLGHFRKDISKKLRRDYGVTNSGHGAGYLAPPQSTPM